MVPALQHAAGRIPRGLLPAAGRSSWPESVRARSPADGCVAAWNGRLRSGCSCRDCSSHRRCSGSCRSTHDRSATPRWATPPLDGLGARMGRALVQRQADPARRRRSVAADGFQLSARQRAHSANWNRESGVERACFTWPTLPAPSAARWRPAFCCCRSSGFRRARRCSPPLRRSRSCRSIRRACDVERSISIEKPPGVRPPRAPARHDAFRSRAATAAGRSRLP